MRVVVAGAAQGSGGTEPIAWMIRHLLGPGGDWISGSILNVSGGEWKGR
jgi:hypothetical protein